MHGYFLLGGDPAHPIVYEVDRTRDGGSFTTRDVKAIQHGRPIFTMSVSFHKARRASSTTAHARRAPAGRVAERAELKKHLIAHLPENIRPIGNESARSRCGPWTSGATSRGRRRHRSSTRGCAPTAFFRTTPSCISACWLTPPIFTLLDTALIAHGKLLFDRDNSACQPRPCVVAAPALPRRRVAALRPG